MPENHLLGILVQLAEGNKPAPFLHNLSSRNFESLRISEDAGVLFLDQNALFPPGGKIPRCPRIDAVAPLGIEQFRQA